MIEVCTKATEQNGPDALPALYLFINLRKRFMRSCFASGRLLWAKPKLLFPSITHCHRLKSVKFLRNPVSEKEPFYRRTTFGYLSSGLLVALVSTMVFSPLRDRIFSHVTEQVSPTPTATPQPLKTDTPD